MGEAIGIGCAVIWFIGWIPATVFFLERFDYADYANSNDHAERAFRMGISLLIAVFWPVMIALAIVTFPIWLVALIAHKRFNTREQRRRNARS